MKLLNAIIAMILLGCSTPDGTSHIVVIFDSIQSNSDTIFFKTGGQLIIAQPILTFCPDDSTEKIGSIYKIVKDTLLIPTKSDHLLISYRFAPINYFSFLAKNGDTIKINHVQGVPFVVVANRTVAPFDCNYDFYRRKRYMLIDSTSILEHLSHPSYLRYMGIVNDQKYGKVAEGLPAKAIEEMLDEQQWIDSLRNHKLMSSVVFEYLKNNNNYICETLELSLGRGKTDEELEKILTEYNDSKYRTDYYYPYRLYYREVVDRYCRSKTQSVDGLNYKSAYQYLKNDHLIQGKLREDILSAWIIPIIDQSLGHEKKVYFEEIVNQLTDTTFIRYLRERYKYDMVEAVTLSTELELLSTSGKRTNFKDLLAKHRGKMIYVDFWASWCAPCMADMPEARKLRHRYEGNRDVVFIYLSLDKHEQAWLNSIENALLMGVEENYRILNIDSASLLKEIQLNTVPRCLLYDGEGQLVDKDAPRASSPQIGRLLDRYINKEKRLR